MPIMLGVTKGIDGHGLSAFAHPTPKRKNSRASGLEPALGEHGDGITALTSFNQSSNRYEL
jgi:hypothetical protein